MCIRHYHGGNVVFVELFFINMQQKQQKEYEGVQVSSRFSKKKINITKVLKTIGGHPVRCLSFQTIQVKKSLQYSNFIQGQVLWYDELVRAKVWIVETWTISGKHLEFSEFSLIENVKNDAIENQLQMF
jgi:hypothetical protein